MLDLVAAVVALPVAQRDATLALLDALSRPLANREIENALVGSGLTRSQRRAVTKAIAPFHIIALVGPERG